MIIEPVRAGSRGPRRGLATRLGLAFPFVVLVAVVGLGVVGRTGEAARPANDTTAAAASPSLAPAEDTAGQLAGDGTRTAETAHFPSTIFGLPVHSTAETLRLRTARRLSGVVAVSGYLSISGERASCSPSSVPPGGLGSFCHRAGILADLPESPFNAAEGGVGWWLGPHLHPQFPAGTRLPEEAARTVLAAQGAPLPVILLGRFDDPRAVKCRPGGRHCGEELAIDRVAWADGEVWRRSTAFDPLVDADIREKAWRSRPAIVASTLRGNPPLLSATLVAPQTLARVEPAAADALPRNPPEALWFIRGLAVTTGRRGEPPVGHVTWTLVDAKTGEMLAQGPAGSERR